MEEEKYYMGIDPGKQGGFAIINQEGKVVKLQPMPLIGKEYDKMKIAEIFTEHYIEKVGLENPNVMFGVAKSSAVSLMRCVGMLEGMLIGLGIPHILVQPKEWQKEGWKYVKTQKKSDGKTDTKATSYLAANNLWPNVDFKITEKGNPSTKFHDGLVDASLIAEYVRRKF